MVFDNKTIGVHDAALARIMCMHGYDRHLHTQNMILNDYFAVFQGITVTPGST